MNDESHDFILDRGKDRVRELGEVFTHKREVNAMLDLVGDVSHNITSRFLEPACGNGNFLTAILGRKLETVKLKFKGKPKDYEFNGILALASVYGVDISDENIADSRKRLRSMMDTFYAKRSTTFSLDEDFMRVVDYILERNVILGDMVDGQHKIVFTEFTSPKTYKIQQKTFRLTDMTQGGLFSWVGPAPIEEIPMKNFWEL